MTDLKTSYEEMILAWLRSKNGEVTLVTALAKKFQVGESSLMTMLNELAACGKVRRSSAKRMLGYYVPTEAMLNAERKASEEAPERRVLTVDKHRRELYARLAAARSSIRSIG